MASFDVLLVLPMEFVGNKIYGTFIFALYAMVFFTFLANGM